MDPFTRSVRGTEVAMGPRHLTTETRRRLLKKPLSHREHGEMTQRNDEQSLVKSRFHAVHCQSPRPTSRNPLQKRGKERPVRQPHAVLTMADSISKKLLFQSLSVFCLCALRVSVVECQGRRRRPHQLICPWFTPGHGEDPPALPGPATTETRNSPGRGGRRLLNKPHSHGEHGEMTEG